MKKIEDRTPFVTVKHLPAKAIRSIELSLPPLEEQRRIAGILDRADALRRKQQQMLKQADDFLRATFLDMFGNVFSNPKLWQKKSLGEISEKFSDGPFGSNLKSEHYVKEGIRVIRLQNVGIGDFISKDAAFISKGHFRSLSKHGCLPGDVIIGTLGDPNLRAFIQPPDLDVALNKADCIQCRVNPNIATKEYVCALLNQPSCLALASTLLHGQTRVRISMGTLKSLQIPVPPLDLQKKFSAIFKKTKDMNVTFHAQTEKKLCLFNALSQRAFRGEL
ncbi:MAG: restriction endonuclease subunit S [Flavobacteriia bacterium]|nr:restriction endonuclease subunit S [Flavobacteriia bacterium]